jgi:hypothetical protein
MAGSSAAGIGTSLNTTVSAPEPRIAVRSGEMTLEGSAKKNVTNSEKNRFAFVGEERSVISK